MISSIDAFLHARDQLVSLREDLPRAHREFQWPEGMHFNWALDYFDRLAQAEDGLALRVVSDSSVEQSLSFRELSERSNQVANQLRALGISSGDKVLVMLGNTVPLWETIMALIKLRAVIVPTSTLLQEEDLEDRVTRGSVSGVVTDASLTDPFARMSALKVRVCIGSPPSGWTDLAASHGYDRTFTPDGPTPADAPLLFYFTSGTTAKPKIVVHTHRSYPVGHLSTMYWLGLRPGDVHLNLSSPGWAKHAWSSFFAPWNAAATVLSYSYERFNARALLDHMVKCRVTTLCAPPTVWRILIQEDLAKWPVALREVASAGEPLNPEVIEQVQRAWNLTIRDGFGQTETTAQIRNPPGQPLKLGSMGRALPGHRVVLVTADGTRGDEGEICLDLSTRPASLMAGYLSGDRVVEPGSDGLHHTGDVASRDADGYITFVGRTDDVFKSSDYRISPFELESVLIEHAAVAEAAVVPSPDARRLSVPKAYVILAPGIEPNSATAASILAYVKERVSPYKRIRRIQFSDLPKTISGKIRRVELRNAEQPRADTAERWPGEFWEEDFPPR